MFRPSFMYSVAVERITKFATYQRILKVEEKVMSGIGGVFNFYGSPFNGSTLSTLKERLNARGPDGGHAVTGGSLGMVYRAFHSNAESHLEWQPMCTSRGHMLAWDGRLDNRGELLVQFPHGIAGDTTDVAL